MSQLIPDNNWSKGASNLAAADRVPDGFAREIINLDPNPGGELSLRSGYELAAALPSVRAAVPYQQGFLIAAADQLLRFNSLDNSLRPLATIAPAGRFCGAELNGDAFICTANERLWVHGDDVYPWGIEPVFPGINIGAGQLPAGVYRVAVTVVTENGVESGAIASIASLPADSSLQVLFEMPVGAVKARLYVSVADGETLFRQGENTGQAFMVERVRDDTARLSTENLVPPPPGDLVEAHHGRLLIAAGSVLFITEAFTPHLHHRIKGFIAYPKPISVVKSVGNFVFVCADKTYRLQALGTGDQNQDGVLSVGAVPGSGVSLPDGRAAWMTRFGQAIADSSGAVNLPNRESYAPVAAERAAVGVLDHGGNQMVITAMRGKIAENSLGFTDFYQAEFEP